jgi:hypothetical protein
MNRMERIEAQLGVWCMICLALAFGVVVEGVEGWVTKGGRERRDLYMKETGNGSEIDSRANKCRLSETRVRDCAWLIGVSVALNA